MTQVISNQAPSTDINSNNGIFDLCAIWVNENYGLGKLVSFRDLLLKFKETVEQYSIVEYKIRDKNNTGNDNPYIEKLQTHFSHIQSFIQQLENSYHLIFGLQEYQNLNKKFFQKRTTLQPGLIFTDSHAEWLLIMNRINNFVELEMSKHNQMLEKKNRGLLFDWNPFRIEYEDSPGTEQTLIESSLESGPEEHLKKKNKCRIRIGASLVGITVAATFIFSNN